MHLLRLRVSNFRSFYGAQDIVFSSQETKGVTLIHGENGAGKTNLLNAIFWCLTGSFTPRLSNPELLVNKAAYDEDRRAECFVDLRFRHEGREYQVVRTVTGRGSHDLNMFALDEGKPRPVQDSQRVLERIIPKGLSRWFFFDAEAIGELELSGSDEFRRSLRRVLGFELVDVLIDDLEACLRKRQKNLTNVIDSKELSEIQAQIDGIAHVLPAQREKAKTLDAQIHALDSEIERIEGQLRNQPKSRPLQEQRTKLEARRKARVATRNELKVNTAAFIGESAPALLGFKQTMAFEGQLHVKENTGKLPAPYSDQLVEDILHTGLCVCGRPVAEHSPESDKIRGLLRNASTSNFNTRVRSIQYLLKDIRSARERYDEALKGFKDRASAVDTEVAEIDQELADIKVELQKIDEDSIRSLESKRSEAQSRHRELTGQHAVVTNRIDENERKIRDLQLRYDNAAKKLGHGDAVKKEIDKIKRLSQYITSTLRSQELRALNLLQLELNQILDRYLTKHFSARIVPKTYEVGMVDDKGREVGRSTGEGQVLKFAFITTVIALAGRKTQEKIDFLAEPTVAPLVLDAPFSALDPEYQSSVARNIAAQATQLVLLISSAAWSEGVAEALEPLIGKRYILISRQAGPRGKKPVKTMTISGKKITLNEYDAERDETVIKELR